MGPPGNLTHITAFQPQPGTSTLFLPNTETTHQPGLRPGILLGVPQVPDDSLPGATLVVGFSGDVALDLARRAVDPVAYLHLDQIPDHRLPKGIFDSRVAPSRFAIMTLAIPLTAQDVLSIVRAKKAKVLFTYGDFTLTASLQERLKVAYTVALCGTG